MTHELLEDHWRATQKLARTKEIAVAVVALALAVVDAGHGKPHGLTSGAGDLADTSKLLDEIPFDHDLRREVLLQELGDTHDTCGKPGGQSLCDKLVGAYNTAKKAVDAVHDVQNGRVLAALGKAMDLADGGASEAEQQRARRLAVLPLIPETPALSTLQETLAAAGSGRGAHARVTGKAVVSSTGVAKLVDDLGT